MGRPVALQILLIAPLSLLGACDAYIYPEATVREIHNPDNQALIERIREGDIYYRVRVATENAPKVDGTADSNKNPLDICMNKAAFNDDKTAATVYLELSKDDVGSEDGDTAAVPAKKPAIPIYSYQYDNHSNNCVAESKVGNVTPSLLVSRNDPKSIVFSFAYTKKADLQVEQGLKAVTKVLDMAGVPSAPIDLGGFSEKVDNAVDRYRSSNSTTILLSRPLTFAADMPTQFQLPLHYFNSRAEPKDRNWKFLSVDVVPVGSIFRTTQQDNGLPDFRNTDLYQATGDLQLKDDVRGLEARAKEVKSSDGLAAVCNAVTSKFQDRLSGLDLAFVMITVLKANLDFDKVKEYTVMKCTSALDLWTKAKRINLALNDPRYLVVSPSEPAPQSIAHSEAKAAIRAVFPRLSDASVDADRRTSNPPDPETIRRYTEYLPSKVLNAGYVSINDDAFPQLFPISTFHTTGSEAADKLANIDLTPNCWLDVASSLAKSVGLQPPWQGFAFFKRPSGKVGKMLVRFNKADNDYRIFDMTFVRVEDGEFDAIDPAKTLDPKECKKFKQTMDIHIVAGN